MKYMIPILFCLCACNRHPPTFTATFTKKKLIGSDEIRAFEEVTSVKKAGWITSDRYVVYMADGTVQVLNGSWEVKLCATPK